MSLVTPTTKEISDNIIAQLEATLNQTIPLLPKSFLRVLSKAMAGVFIILYKYGGFMFLQMFVQSASAKDTTINGVTVNPLTEWGRLIGVGDPEPATNAELAVDITVENQTGSLSSGTQLVNTSNGVTYITIGIVLLNAPTVTVNILAAADQAGGGGAGAIGNLDLSDIVSFASPLANVARDTVVTAQNVTGADAESADVYRQKIIDRFQNRPQGGALADYKIWSEEVAGIINAFPYTSECPGQVDVYVEATEASSGSADGIPTGAQLQAVLDSIELDENGLASRRPATALANTFAIVRTEFDVNVLGIVVDNLSQVQTDITAGVTEYFLEREPFLPGLSALPRKDRITRASVECIVNDIVSAAGGIFSSVTVSQNSIIQELYNLGIGEKSKVGTVAYV